MNDVHNNFLSMVGLVCHVLTIFSGFAFFRSGCISHGSVFFSLSPTQLLTRTYTDQLASIHKRQMVEYLSSIACSLRRRHWEPIYSLTSNLGSETELGCFVRSFKLSSRRQFRGNNWRLLFLSKPTSEHVCHHLDASIFLVHTSFCRAQCNTIQGCTSWLLQMANNFFLQNNSSYVLWGGWEIQRNWIWNNHLLQIFQLKSEMRNLTTKIPKRLAVCGLVNADLISIYRLLDLKYFYN